VYSQKNLGQTAAKNTGIRQSQGKYIAFCDADDLWALNKAELQINVLESKENVGVVYSGVRNIDASGQVIDESTYDQFYRGKVTDNLMFSNFVPFGSAMLRREVIEDLNSAFDTRYQMGIDWDLWLKVSVNWDFEFIAKPLYIYRKWAGQMSRNYHGRYRHALEILSNFDQSHKGAISRMKMREAISDIYANYAYHISLYEGRTLSMYKNSMMAIVYFPFSTRILKRILRSWLKRF
jgi:glycosyltransferase involved in cell wall biosynthesis